MYGYVFNKSSLKVLKMSDLENRFIKALMKKLFLSPPIIIRDGGIVTTRTYARTEHQQQKSDNLPFAKILEKLQIGRY
jgi:hypothetical protein